MFTGLMQQQSMTQNLLPWNKHEPTTIVTLSTSWQCLDYSNSPVNAAFDSLIPAEHCPLSLSSGTYTTFIKFL